MLDGLHREIDVQLRPMEVMWRRPLDVQHLPDRCGLEPRKALEREKELAVIEK